MPALHDYICAVHGKFDSFNGKCPHGCGKELVQKVFSAPALISSRTKNIDKTVRDLANDAGVTNLNNRGGQAAFQYDSKMDVAAEDMRRQFLSGQTFSGALNSGDNGIAGTLADNNLKGDNALTQVKDLLTQPKAIPTASWNGKD